MLKLSIEWSRPVRLKDATRENLIYILDLEKLQTSPGVYILGRQWGNQFEALYVGLAKNIRVRMKQQLKNNVQLMQSLKNAKGGNRIVLAGRFIPKPGQQLTKCLRLAERALIRYFLSEGHDLVNIQGMHVRRHEVASTGKYPKRFFPKLMYVERGKG